MSIREAKVGKFLFESCDELGADSVLLVILLVVVALLEAGIAADWGDVDHAISEQWQRQRESSYRRTVALHIILPLKALLPAPCGLQHT